MKEVKTLIGGPFHGGKKTTEYSQIEQSYYRIKLEDNKPEINYFDSETIDTVMDQITKSTYYAYVLQLNDTPVKFWVWSKELKPDNAIRDYVLSCLEAK